MKNLKMLLLIPTFLAMFSGCEKRLIEGQLQDKTKVKVELGKITLTSPDNGCSVVAGDTNDDPYLDKIFSNCPQNDPLTKYNLSDLQRAYDSYINREIK